MEIFKISGFAPSVLLTLAVTSSLAQPSNPNQIYYITSPEVTDFGVWGREEFCPPGRAVQAFQLKTHPKQLLGDDTALNGIRLFCGNPHQHDTAVLTSTVGDFGVWGSIFDCQGGFLTGFQLRVEPHLGSGDDTATNNVRFFCSSASSFIEGDGQTFGNWGLEQRCLPNQAICSLKTQVEPDQGNGDDTALNNVSLACCNRS